MPALIALAAAAVTLAGTGRSETDHLGGTRAGSRSGIPARLSEAGLYQDIVARRIDPRNLPYVPQYPLWSDGAEKRRWVFLPRGSTIDAADPEAWRFPIGTKLWKEFAWDHKPVETRMLQRTRNGWLYAAYVWNEAGTEALLAPQGGLESTHELGHGRRHFIPAVADCKNCHQGGRTEVLGFGALQLSPDRDPLAPHAEPVPPDAVTLPVLVARGLLRRLPRALVEHPPRILAATQRGRAALGYLHANCGGCHDTTGAVASVGLALRHALSARSPEAEPAMIAVGHESRYRAPGVPDGQSFWIEPGVPSHSTVLTRIASRSPAAQMPPLGTQLVDDEAVALITAWIRDDLPGEHAPAHGTDGNRRGPRSGGTDQ